MSKFKVVFAVVLALALLGAEAEAATLKSVSSVASSERAKHSNGGVVTLTIIAKTKGVRNVRSQSQIGQRDYWRMAPNKFVSSARVVIPAGTQRKQCFKEQFILSSKRGARQSTTRRVCFRLNL